MKLFAEKTDFENPLYCYFPCEEEFRDSAQIRFETENPSLQKAVKELFNDSPDAALCPAYKYDNPNLFIDEIYLTLYGKPLDEMYKGMGNDDSWQNREKTGAKPWNKDRVLSINSSLSFSRKYFYQNSFLYPIYFSFINSIFVSFRSDWNYRYYYFLHLISRNNIIII